MSHKSPTPPERSDGARRERKAIRSYLRRYAHKLKTENPNSEMLFAIGDTLDWLLARSKRYDARPGGLGKR